MGLLFNYDKPGPGIDKNAPKKKGIFLFLELLGRNLSNLLLSNMLYFIVSLPVSAPYFMIVSYFLGMAMPEAVGAMALTQTAVIITLLIVILWGTGPVSCGYTYILRNMAREEHAFICSDFFEKSKESFRRGLVFLIVDIAVLICSVVAIWAYWGMATKTGGIYTVLFLITVLMLCIYTIMHFYMYELEVTFEGGIFGVYKNSLIMAFATLPMCILIGSIIVFVSITLLGFLSPLGVLLVAFLCWISLMRFVVDFYVARFVKRTILSKYENSVKEEK